MSNALTPQDKAVSIGMPLMFPASAAEIAERDRKIGDGDLDL